MAIIATSADKTEENSVRTSSTHTLKKQDQLLATFGQNVIGNLERQFGAEGRGLELKKRGDRENDGVFLRDHWCAVFFC